MILLQIAIELLLLSSPSMCGVQARAASSPPTPGPASGQHLEMPRITTGSERTEYFCFTSLFLKQSQEIWFTISLKIIIFVKIKYLGSLEIFLKKDRETHLDFDTHAAQADSAVSWGAVAEVRQQTNAGNLNIYVTALPVLAAASPARGDWD